MSAFSITTRAYERTSLIVTTNLPFENWTEVLGSERLTGATLDRLTHRCHILQMNGQSFRVSDARKHRMDPFADPTKPQDGMPEEEETSA